MTLTGSSHLALTEMGKSPYGVVVVVDPNFGEKLATLPGGVPVWIVDSDANTPVAHRLWKLRPTDTHLNGITAFRGNPKSTPEENLIDHLGTIDLHHGEYSADPPYSEVQVLGAPLTDRIRKAMQDYGFHRFVETADGFVAAVGS